MDNRPLLIEIGMEEIPARFIPGARRDMDALIRKLLAEVRLSHGEVKTCATPRRLAVIVQDVQSMQKDHTSEVLGPPKKAGVAPDGSFTKAATGFAASQGVKPEDLVIRPKEGKGEYLAAIVEEKGRASKEILPELCKSFVMGLSFPKSMRWGYGTMRFARPVHWVVSLYGSDALTFDIEGVTSGKKSRGHRFLSPAEFDVSSPNDYIAELEARKVVVEPETRMKYIAAQSAQLAQSVGGKPVYSDELLSIVACLLEYPVAVLGGFDKKYLGLPDELLEAVMVGHQKYFPVAGADGRLVNNFIIVSNTLAENADTVRKGAERVIRARFDDARFYFDDDRSRKLMDRLDDLKVVTFQDKLGSLHDKAIRMQALAGKVADIIAPALKADAERAACIAKSDLITGVVREFPELQGVMGMYYARHDGESEQVALALKEQYMPISSGSEVPTSDLGAIVSIADKLDNLGSFFSIELRPTGSEDPFALRRQALGVIAILLDRGHDASIRQLLSVAVPSGGKLEADLVEFFEQRIENILLSRGYAHDMVQAVLRLSTALSLRDVVTRIDALKSFKAHPKYKEFLIAIKRVRNISPAEDVQLPDVSESLFRADEERVLDSVMDTVVKDMGLMIEGHNYKSAIDVMMKLTDPINAFFEKVLVMDKDEAVKKNRLALLREIWLTVSRLADLSKLSEDASVS